MFTGLVEEIGTVAAVGPHEGGFSLRLRAGVVLDGMARGDSIAVDGTCLTVTAFDADSFTVGLAPETLARTSLGDLKPGGRVNLERACLPTTRLGGHYVQGHVDGTGVILRWRADGDAMWLSVNVAPGLMRYIVPKGYVAIDGASLTVVHVGDDWFDVTLIAYSQEKLALTGKKPGARVNIEVDIIAKYVERLVAPALSDAPRETLAGRGFIREGSR